MGAHQNDKLYAPALIGQHAAEWLGDGACGLVSAENQQADQGYGHQKIHQGWQQIVGPPVASADQKVRAFLLGYPGVTAIRELLATFVGRGRVWIVARVDQARRLIGCSGVSLAEQDAACD